MLSTLLKKNAFSWNPIVAKQWLLILLPRALHFYSFSSACQPLFHCFILVLMQVVLAFLQFLAFSMSGSSNDHVLRDGARPDEMDDIFSTLSHRQLNVLYGVLANNSCRMVFMDRLQNFVVATTLLEMDHPKKLCRKQCRRSLPKSTTHSALEALRLFPGPIDLRDTALVGDQMWLLL